jgi:hypothetical protein
LANILVKNILKIPIASQWINEAADSTTGYLEFDCQKTSEIFIFTRESRICWKLRSVSALGAQGFSSVKASGYGASKITSSAAIV